jgi:hypothetical protein
LYPFTHLLEFFILFLVILLDVFLSYNPCLDYAFVEMVHLTPNIFDLVP